MNQDKILQFLLDLKAAVSTRGINIIPRKSTLSTLQLLGMTKKNLQDELLSLSLVDYSKGPERDQDHDGDIWVFGKSVSNHEMYIKLKIFRVDGVYHAKCISFHVAEFTLSYPFKNT